MPKTQEQPTCQERIDDKWTRRKADLAIFMDDLDGNENVGPFHEYGLAFDYLPANTFNEQKIGYWRYQLSWGGPADEIRFYGDPEGQIYCVEYWFMDWFDGALLYVTDENVIAWLIEELKETGIFAAALKDVIEE